MNTYIGKTTLVLLLMRKGAIPSILLRGHDDTDFRSELKKLKIGSSAGDRIAVVKIKKVKKSFNLNVDICKIDKKNLDCNVLDDAHVVSLTIPNKLFDKYGVEPIIKHVAFYLKNSKTIDQAVDIKNSAIIKSLADRDKQNLAKSDIKKKSFHCAADNTDLTTYQAMRKHLMTNKHKSAVEKNFPDTMITNTHNGVVLSTGRIDLTKIKQYIKAIPKIPPKDKKNIKRKAGVVLSPADYAEEWMGRTADDMATLIKRFIKGLKKAKINIETYMDDPGNIDDMTDDELADAFNEVRDLMLDTAADNIFSKLV
jgi:hypothetical protein